MSIRLEKAYPLLGAVLATAVYAYVKYGRGVSIVANLSTVMQVVVIFSGILIGFVSTSKSLLFAIPDRPFVNKVREAGGFILLLEYMLSSIRHALILSGVSIIYIAVADQISSFWREVLVVTWFFFLVLAGLAFYRVSGLLSELLGRVLKAPSKT